MKLTILLSILFELLAKRQVTATDLAEKHGVSPRTIYRYIDLLSTAVPVYIKRGRNGGVCIADNYKLPVGFMTKEEYDAAIEALEEAYSRRPEDRFLQAKRKLSSQEKHELRELVLSGEVGSIFADSSVWGDTHTFSEKLLLIEECIHDKTVVEIEYLSPENKKSHRKIEPHALVFRQNVWYVFAFCHKQRDFYPFCLGRILSVLKTEERFSRRPFARENLPFQTASPKTIDVRFEISAFALADAQTWLGAENIRWINEKWQSHVALPDDETLVRKIIGFGSGIKVLFPASLRERIATTVNELKLLYG